MSMEAVSMLRLLAVLLTVCIQSTTSQRLAGSVFGASNPGLLNVYEHSSGGPETTYSILASSYDTGRSTYDNAFILYHPGLAMSTAFEGYSPRLIYNVLYWPKEMTQVPNPVFNFDAIAIPDGSTIFGKTAGSIYIANVDDFSFPSTTNILEVGPVPSNYMYSSLVWVHADEGTTWDIVTCRVLVEDGVMIESQLLYFDHPATDDMNNRWPVHVLKESACDTNVARVNLDLGGVNGRHDVIYTTGFYLMRLSLFYTTQNMGEWSNPDDIVGIVLEQGRQYYDVLISDINNDGNPDVLTTVVDRYNGSVEVWEIPSDFRVPGDYIRHVLAEGFMARTGGVEGRSPGVAKPFYPTSTTDQKPWIAVTGADDGMAYVLSPVSQDPSDWNYQLMLLYDYGTSQTVSGIAAADVNGDGFTELFVSVHNMNVIQVFTYSPAD